MILDYQKSTSFVVRELLLKAEKPSFSLVIGIPRENQEVEKRLALTPESVALLVAAGYRVLLQAGAGLTI
ncbi:MAG: alanine dehydrogenase, partial [Proteiniphilum sp.]